jgi:hypothetical protein
MISELSIIKKLRWQFATLCVLTQGKINGADAAQNGDIKSSQRVDPQICVYCNDQNVSALILRPHLDINIIKNNGDKHDYRLSSCD